VADASLTKKLRSCAMYRLDDNVEVKSTRLRFSTRSTLKWCGFIQERGGGKEETVKWVIWTFGVVYGASALKGM
jgi:hypothetical protein